METPGLLSPSASTVFGDLDSPVATPAAPRVELPPDCPIPVARRGSITRRTSTCAIDGGFDEALAEMPPDGAVPFARRGSMRRRPSDLDNDGGMVPDGALPVARRGSIRRRPSTCESIEPPESPLARQASSGVGSASCPSSPGSMRGRRCPSSASALSYRSTAKNAELPPELQPGWFLVDFIKRIREGDHPKFESEDETKDSTHRPTPAEILMQPHHYPGWGGYAFACLAVNNEVLLAKMWEDITKFWKVMVDHPAWRVTPSSFRKRVAQINDWHNAARRLKAAATAWIFRNKIIHCRPPDEETAQERHDRKQLFWSHFHDGSRKEEVTAVSYPFKDDLRKRLYGDEEDGIRPKAASLHRCLKRSIKPSPESEQVPARPKTAESTRQTRAIDLNWKQRSARSKVSLGNWDWTRGAPNKLRPASATTTRERKHEHWSAALFDVTDSELQEYAEIAEDKEEMYADGCSETFLCRPSKYVPRMGSTTESSRMGTKSSSLPNLLHNKIARDKAARETRAAMAKTAVYDNVFSEKRVSRSGTIKQRPPLTPAQTPPWHGTIPQPALRCADSHPKQYFRACRKAASLPMAFPFITGHSLKMKTGSRMLCDEDLQNITVVLDELSLQEVDLKGNTLLTEKSLLKFFAVLSQPPASTSLVSLSLNHCLQASKLSVLQGMIRLVDGVRQLRHLDLTDVAMSIRCQASFAEAVHSHPTLSSLTLCNTGLGLTQGPDTKDFIYDLLGGQALKALDLGWNSFSVDFFSCLGECLVYTRKLRQLGLSNCSASPKFGTATNIVHFLEYLSHDKTLTSLDVSLNNIDFRGGLVLEDALMNCANLSTLNASNNPLGVFGIRSLFRLLSLNSSGLMHFDCQDAFSGSSKAEGEGSQVFSSTMPGGRYVLELQRVYHRALLRMLYKTCDRFQLSPADAFSNVAYSASAFTHAAKDDDGVWIVPNHGTLSVTFSIDKAIQKEMEGLNLYDFEGYIHTSHRLMRCSPSARKIVPLFAQWAGSAGRMQEQLVMLDAMSKEFQFTYPHMRQFCKTSSNIVGEIIERLFSCLDEQNGARFLTLSLNKGLPNYVRCYKNVLELLRFNPQNPNGHYKLDLSNHIDYCLAERLLLLDRWESGVTQRRGLMDISQRGNWSVVRNETYANLPIQVRAISEWLLPEHDRLELDYTSNRRPSADDPPLDDITHANVMIAVQQSGCQPADQIAAFRMVAHSVFLTSKQLRLLFSIFRNQEEFVELLITFFCRVHDIHNEKIYRCRIEQQSLLVELSKRLGYLAVFPFIQPEQSRFVLNLAERDQRITANMLMVLSKSEDPYNLRNPEYLLPNGTRDPLTAGIPRTWELLDKVPTGGMLSITYVCGPDRRNVGKRLALLQHYGHRATSHIQPEDISWWSSLKEAPQEVIEYLEFIVSRYDDTDEAFLDIAGNGFNAFSLRAFEDAYTKMGCKKFEGADEMQRLAIVFRFLDPNGTGQVTAAEFSVLGQMFREIVLSIEEFAEFCVRTFGDDPQDTWTFIDPEDKGDIDMQEWMTACDNLGYLGPVAPIFRFLDKEDDHTISCEKFLELDKFFDEIVQT